LKAGPEETLSSRNVYFECPECDQVGQVNYVGGPWTGLIQCDHCGRVLWASQFANRDI